jgi:hypothetical protein
VRSSSESSGATCEEDRDGDMDNASILGANFEEDEDISIPGK